MSSSWPTQITLGGCIARRLVPRLCSALGRGQLTLAGGIPFDPCSAEDLLRARRSGDGALLLRQRADAPRRQLVLLEAFLTKHKIAFDRFSYESPLGGQLVVFRPGHTLKCLRAGRNGEVVVAAEGVWDLVDQLQQVRQQLQRGTWRCARHKLQAALRDFRQHLPCELPALAAFEIGQSQGLRKAS